MTTEIDALKTNEFIRRRKLRLQQVRDQSKDIAKKIRQRAKVEKLKQVSELDAKKQKEYFQRQELLVKTLEEFYAKGIENVGASHRNASEVKLQEKQREKVDPSKQRGKEAAAELRRKKQEKLDEQKKLLDRKVQAREAANEVSREKSVAVLNKLLSNKDLDVPSKDCIPEKDCNDGGDGSEVKCNDMATQWDLEPEEWQPNIPKLSLPSDDKDIKENNNNIESKPDRSRRLDLFALSEEMPSSLRGGLTTQEERVPVKSSLTLVSEYLQTRGLRLREKDTAESSKKNNMDELHKLKQTILRTRAPKEGTCVCQVHDEELVPVPTWRAENNCGFCSHSISHHKQFKHTRTCSSLHVNNVLSPVKPLHPDLLPSPVLRGTTPFRRNRIPLRSFSAKGNNEDRASKSSAVNSAAPKKSSVTMYNHSTRMERDIPCNDERLVIRDLQIDDDDAYSQAMKESSIDNKERDHQKKVQEVRSKIAMKKQDVEKEYKDTISFLNSLPKDMGNKPIRRAFMDEDRRQTMRDNRQQKLQQEYKKIVKDCKKRSCRNKTRSNSKSPSKFNDDFDSTDFQYSWMPVPESDGNLAIHTIPTSLKEGKSGNSVKFSKVDSYHEYRSRHKHTPPTKDTSQQPKRFAETVPGQNSSDSESVISEISSTENIQLEKKDQMLKETERLSDAERIIIYKILDSKIENSRNSKIIKDIAKSLTLIEKQNTAQGSKSNSKKSKTKKFFSDSDRKISFEELNEGVYKAVNGNGTGDNIASMYFDKDGDKIELTNDEIKYGRPCCCCKTVHKDQLHEKGTTSLQWESGDNPPKVPRPTNTCSECKCGCKNPPHPKLKKVIEENTGQSARQPSAATSTSSFKTATYEKANNALPDGGYIKLIDEGGEEAGKFYIGASGFLRDDAYEVVIQLRKKGDEKEVTPDIPTDLTKINENLVDNASVSVVATTITDTPESAEEVNTARSVPDESKEHKTSNRSNKIQDVVVNITSEVLINRNDKNLINKSNEVQNPERRNVKDVSEKCVSTSFQDSFAIPSNFPKSDLNPRPATSTYTQTSMSSPNPRPVFFHMSSSTSTAYMSPPEMILPKFLRQDHRMSDDDLYDPRNFEMQDKIEVTDEHEYCEDYECKCRVCRHARKITLCRTNAHRCTKSKHRSGQTGTPPNTARSDQDEIDDVEITDSNSRENCKCRKCRSRNHLDKPVSSTDHVNKNKRINKTKQSSQNLITRAISSSASTNKDGQKKRNKTSLNPIIRDYVNKLLALNKESLKAVQVVDQDCSSVATPGSSIINMPNNSNSKKTAIENKISLEQIKTMLKQQILDECQKKTIDDSDVCLRDHCSNRPKAPRRKTIHKVKSLNISKKLFRSKKASDNVPRTKLTSSSSSMKEDHFKIPPLPCRSKIRSKSSPTPRSAPTHVEVMRSKTSTNVAPSASVTKTPTNLCTKSSKINFREHKSEARRNESSGLSCHRATTTSMTPNSETSASRQMGKNQETPSNMSTQTSNVDSEINFLRFDEDKIQNMEKIADLTEKCTKRLSNLAKVLEEVRRNKSLAYSQISTSDAASDSDHKSDKIATKASANVYQSFHDTQKSLESKSPDTFTPVEELNENGCNVNSDDFLHVLNDIPKPDSFKTPTLELSYSSNSSNKSSNISPVSEHSEHHMKRGKPPPALSRIHLKHVHDYVIPHELSTVVEVDSPMSVKLKSQTSRNETRLDVPDSFNRIDNETYKANHQNEERYSNPDLLVSNVDIPGQAKMLTTESSDNSKIQMIDMNQFNEIMLKPFFSLHEYAKHHNVGALDDGSNLEDFARGDIVNDELSSLHSDGSLPDVISELLKRNIISEPFKFDTQSNVNSTTISSESSLSVLALSKVRKDKKKSSVIFQNKENIAETSDTMSISSNPDLESAFKMLGMGWASSTLKKTKERLALSSSSNTSSSSLSQFKIKSFNPDIPVLVTDTVSSVLNLSNNKQQKRNTTDTSKHAEQQTSLTNSMTVKEFLTNELSKKITFNNKSRNDTEEEFVSLFETKMPEEMKHTSRMVREVSEDNSIRSSNNNRARTSTPVQLFKSMTYRSSSSSNVSNGLFSNADDLSSVKQTSNSMKHSTSDKDDLTIPNFSLKIKKGPSECSKSD